MEERLLGNPPRLALFCSRSALLAASRKQERALKKPILTKQGRKRMSTDRMLEYVFGIRTQFSHGSKCDMCEYLSYTVIGCRFLPNLSLSLPMVEQWVAYFGCQAK